jgi:transposase
MLYLGAQVRYFYFSQAVDMRKGYYGMSGIVRNEMKRDVLSGDVFVFVNKRYNKIKLLQWDRDGFALYEKHLEKGTFERPENVNESNDILLTHIQLQHILQGVILQSVRQKKRYERMS